VVRRAYYGLAGTAVTHLFRLPDAPPLPAAMTEPGIDLAFIALSPCLRHRHPHPRLLLPRHLTCRRDAR
jgi:hypothetical protein